MMMCVNHGAAGFVADLVELITELRHIRRAVFIAGFDFVQRVNDDGGQIQIPHPAHQLWHQLIQRHSVTTQVPNNDVLPVQRFQLQRLIDFPEAVHAGDGVDFQIDIQRTALFALEAQPLDTFSDRNSQFHQQERLTSFTAAGDQHLVPDAEDTLDQFSGWLQRFISEIFQRHHVRHLVGYTFSEVHPVVPRFSADVRIHQILPVPVPGDSRHPAQAGRIAVLLIHGQAILFQKVIQVFDPFPVLVVITSVNVDDSV